MVALDPVELDTAALDRLKARFQARRT